VLCSSWCNAYPQLLEVVRCALGAATVSSNVERLFSIAGFIKNKLRNRMSPENLDNVVVLRTSRESRKRPAPG
jgi:hypothetical protein